MSAASAGEIVGVLTGLATAQNLRTRAIEGCRLWLANSTEDETDWLDGWTAEQIESRFRSCSLVFDHPIGYPFVDTRLDLYAQERLIGYYRFITLLDGAFDEEYLVIDVPKIIE